MTNNGGWKGGEGPPDLDELWRNVTNKIKSFGHRDQQPVKDGGASSPSQFPVILLASLVAVVWMLSGFYLIDQGSRGLIMRFGRYVQTVGPGPHWHIPYPIEQVEVVNMEQVRTLEVGYRAGSDSGQARNKVLPESLMLTDDENIIDLQFAVQYNLKSVEDFLFNNQSVDTQVRGVAETAMREVVGKSKMDFVLYEGREAVALHAKQLMQLILDRYETGIRVVSVTMQNAQPPEQVQAAFDDAVKAGQDLERQKNEGQAYANDVVPKAKGTAARLLEEAEGYKARVINEAKGNASRFLQVMQEYQKAPKVTRDRLYIDTQEAILGSVSKVVVDQKGGGNLLYLPLDKLLEHGASVSPSLDAEGSQAKPASQINPDKASVSGGSFSRNRNRESRP